MIDRVARDRAALLLRRFAAGRITNFQFDEEYPGPSVDAGVRAVGDRAWNLYDDFREHRLEPAPALRREIARWVVFLHSDAEYAWPRCPFVSIRAPRWLNWLSGGLLHRRQDEEFARWARRGDDSAWPFHTTGQVAAAAAQPRYLRGTGA